jgi:hypothetical protein
VSPILNFASNQLTVLLKEHQIPPGLTNWTQVLLIVVGIGVLRGVRCTLLLISSVLLVLRFRTRQGGRLTLVVGHWALHSVFVSADSKISTASKVTTDVFSGIYWPDGSPGQPSTNDWHESYPAVSLQNGRWYPTAMIMSNGSILVVGGQDGSNGKAVPTLELLPPAGPNITLPFLNRTDPYNLYPFTAVLPSGGIFIAYYNEALVMDEVTFATSKTLPNMPGGESSLPNHLLSKANIPSRQQLPRRPNLPLRRHNGPPPPTRPIHLPPPDPNLRRHNPRPRIRPRQLRLHLPRIRKSAMDY